jgi:hypothetical protein
MTLESLKPFPLTLVILYDKNGQTNHIYYITYFNESIVMKQNEQI